MKKNITILFVLVFTAGFSFAQITKPEVIKKNLPPAKTTPPPANTPPAPNPSVYSLTAARVSIKTGSDNKEFPSKVVVWLISRGNGFALDQPAENLRNEMKVNSTTEFGLQQCTYCDAKNKTLEAFQKQGVMLRIRYLPNFPTDAWKIEGVSLTLEFKDQYGNPHPQYGNKTIVFNNANGFLDAWNGDMECTADAAFTPLTASIKN